MRRFLRMMDVVNWCKGAGQAISNIVILFLTFKSGLSQLYPFCLKCLSLLAQEGAAQYLSLAQDF